MATTAPFYVVGPTGSGKSAIALALAAHWDGEVINADAFQVYADMPIITAGPSDAEMAQVPHHLYGTVPLHEDYNVARYQREATTILTDIQARGKRPIIVGGSGLYIKALTHGLGDVPPGSPELRDGLAELSLAEQVHWLQRLDPIGAAQTNLRNPRYVTRALEITLLSGTPMSVVKQRWASEGPKVPCGIALQWERQALYERINARVHAMIEVGAVNEVANLPESLSDTARKAIGVRELQDHLSGDISLNEAVARIQQASRRFAKRQVSWFKREPAFVPTTLTEDTPTDSLIKQAEQLVPSED